MLLILALGGCPVSDTQVNKVYPNLVVLPESVDFGDVAVNYSGSQDFTITNSGLAKLEITDISLPDDGGGVFDIADVSLPLVLAKDEDATLTLSFVPGTYLPYAGVMHLTSNDEDFPELDVPLSGTGVDAPMPDIEVSSLSVDFGSVDVGNFGYGTLLVENVGEGSLTIDTAALSGSGAFAVLSGDISGYTIPAGQSQTIAMVYAPTLTTGDSGTLTITSNDPDEPSVEVVLAGNGGSDNEYPIAVVDCPSTIEPRKMITLTGSDSYDPNEYEPLTYSWTITQTPEGSAATELLNATQDVAYWQTDIAGDYQVALKVTNSLGLEGAPAFCTVSAIPSELLHVELIWDTGNADLDLHLIETGGAWYNDPEDCNWCNPSPDWGTEGVTDDDPALDLDDIDGYGPENINIDDPQDGTYTVYAHYYEDGGDDAVVATVKVYLYGALVDEMSKVLYRTEIWEVGQVNWPDGTFAELDNTYDDSADDTDGFSGRSCLSE